VKSRAGLLLSFGGPVAGPLLLVLAIGAAYRGAEAVPFMFDDVPAIIDNPTIREAGRLSAVLSPPNDFGTTVNGRPFLNLTLALNYAAGGTSVWGYHLFNLLCHAVAALVLYGLVRRLLGRRTSTAGIAGWAAWAAALLWALHPLQTESVTYIIQRAEVLAALFTLLTLYGFTRACEGDDGSRASGASWRWKGVSVLSSLLGVTCKETAVVAPLLALMLDRTFFAGSFREAWRRRTGFYLTLTATWVVAGGLVWLGGARGGTAGFGTGASAWRYALTQCVAVIHYLRLAFWPSPLVFDYGVGLVDRVANVWPQGVLLLALLVGTVLLLRRRTAAGFAAASFFVMLAPSSSVVPVTTQTMAEHRMYLPLAALAALAATGACLRGGRLGCAAIVAVATGFALMTDQRNRVYQSPLLLWQQTVAHAPGNARAHNNLGRALLEKGDLAGALASFDESLRLAPLSPETLNNRGYALAQSKRLVDAVASYERSLALRPDNPRAHDNLGNALFQLNHTAEAIDHFETALRLRPDFADAHWGLGNALAQSGNEPGAVWQYEDALRLDPGFADAHYSLGVILARRARWEAAMAQYREALRLKPGFPEAENNLGNALYQSGQTEAARFHYRRALLLQPDFTEARINVANVLLANGQAGAALEDFEAALRSAPADLDARSGRASALAQSGHLDAAIDAFHEVLRTNPEHVAARANLANTLLLAGRPVDAAREFEAALRLRPDDAGLRTGWQQARELARERIPP
jgi:tetratricopeptide (TPR) repeat protein